MNFLKQKFHKRKCFINLHKKIDMYGQIKQDVLKTLKKLKEQGLYKTERIITSAQDAEIRVSSGETVLNFCANNYLGLANHPRVIQAAQEVMNY